MISVLVDTDGGVDDAAALLYLLRSADISVSGIIATGSSRPVDVVIQAVANVLRVIDRLDIPICAGRIPESRDHLRSGNRFHGDDGLGGTAVPVSVAELNFAEVGSLVDTLLRQSHDRAILTLGPLTTMADVISERCELLGSVQLVSMGGAFHVPGNASAVAESNFARDPRAASTVFSAGWSLPPRIVSLDVTMEAQLTSGFFDRMAASPSLVAGFIAAPLSYYRKSHCRLYGGDGMPCHDLLAAISLARPMVVSYRLLPVAIDTGHSVASGQVRADERPWIVNEIEPPDDRYRPCLVPVAVDHRAFLEQAGTLLE